LGAANIWRPSGVRLDDLAWPAFGQVDSGVAKLGELHQEKCGVHEWLI